MQLFYGRRLVHQTHLSLTNEPSQAVCTIVEMSIILKYEVFKGWWRLITKLGPGQPSTYFALSKPSLTYRSTRRLHRRLTGASTLTRIKKGRFCSCSKIASSQTSVVTQRCCQFLVTKSKRCSTDRKHGDSLSERFDVFVVGSPIDLGDQDCNR